MNANKPAVLTLVLLALAACSRDLTPAAPGGRSPSSSAVIRPMSDLSGNDPTGSVLGSTTSPVEFKKCATLESVTMNVAFTVSFSSHGQKYDQYFEYSPEWTYKAQDNTWTPGGTLQRVTVTARAKGQPALIQQVAIKLIKADATTSATSVVNVPPIIGFVKDSKNRYLINGVVAADQSGIPKTGNEQHDELEATSGASIDINAKFIDCAAANTAPVITFTSAATEATSATATSVPFTLNVTDKEDAVSPAPSCSYGDSYDATKAITLSLGKDANDTFTGVATGAAIGPVGDTHVTCTATDTANLAASFTFSTIVRDTTAPAVTAPAAPAPAQASAASGATVTYGAATAVDIVDGTLSAACAPESGTTFAIGDTTVTCTAIDAHGNAGSATFKVTVVDTAGPVVGAVSDVTGVQATGPGGAVATYKAPTAADAVDGSRPVTCAPLSGSTFALGETTVTCTAQDTRGNTGTSSFKVEVVDTLGPVISNTPDDLILEAVDSNGAVATWTAPTATDVVDGDVAVTCAAGGLVSGSTFPIGSTWTRDTVVTCTAEDARHNAAASTAFTVTVRDTTAPVISGLHNFAGVEGNTLGGATVEWTATAQDAVRGPVPVTCDAASGQTVFPVDATTTVNCSATDGHTSAPGSFTVSVVDTTPPALSGVPASVTLEATGPGGAVHTWTAPTATDVVDGSVPVTCSPASGSEFAVLTNYPSTATTVTCSASDKHGRAASQQFTVTVKDSTKPVISNTPADITLEGNTLGGAKTAWTVPAAADLVKGTVPVSCDHQPADVFPVGVTTVTCSATDGANPASTTFKITVTDKTPPALSGVPASVTLEATGPGGAVHTWTAPTATDVVDGSVPVTCSPASGSGFALGATLVTCSAADAHGNPASAGFTVTVRDTTPPVFAQKPGDIVKNDGAAITFNSPVAQDLVSGDLTASCTPASGSIFKQGVTTVTCTATDGSNNSSSASFTVTVLFPGGVGKLLDPVNADGSSVFKQGSTVPMKFLAPVVYQPGVGTQPATGLAGGLSFKLTLISSNVAAQVNETAVVVADTSFWRYDSGQYIYNLGTKSYAAGTYRVDIYYNDANGQVLLVSQVFSLRK